MSLLFEHAVERFDLSAATLRSVTDRDCEPTAETVPVRAIAEFAGYHESLAPPDEDWTCIPLHGSEKASPVDEFVAFTDDDLRGPIVVFDRDGDRDFLPVDEFADTALADRVRFWHSDYLPETYPPEYDSPIDDSEPPRNPVDADALLDGFRDFVRAERRATRESNRERARSSSAREIYDQGGDAVPVLDCLGEDDRGEYRFRVDAGALDATRDGDWAYVVESDCGLYEGNEVLLHAPGGNGAGGRPGSTADDFPVPAEIERIRGLNLWLSVEWESIDSSAAVGAALSGGDGFGLSQLLNPVPFDRTTEAVDDLVDHPLLAVLAGERPVTFSNGAAAQSVQLDEELNQEQQLAAEHALLADDFFCVHGPPGTGKTRTLVEIVRRAVQAGDDVLVCADSNQAVDNVVVGSSAGDAPDDTSLHAYGQHGAGEFALERVNAERSTNGVVRRRYGETAERGDVVAATNSSAATLAREFDLAVVDEATQATCTAACIPVTRADRVVLAGDHQQLPPFSATEDPPDTSYGLSLFEHLYADGGVYDGVGLQLKTQYRMHRDVAYFPNREFYDRSLRSGRTVDPLPDRPAIEGFNVGGPVETVDHSYANETEARLVVHLLRELRGTLPASDIGVITPYAAQVSLVRDLCRDRIADADDLAVDTIDSFQGGEKTAVVLSLVRSNGDGEIGFLGRPADGPRRLNVALTRAKRYCAVVGDFHTLRYDADGKCTDLYRDFYEYFDSTGRLNDVDTALLSV
ncbi:MAG: AAA domain-containing protein [Halosimplex sp.]